MAGNFQGLALTALNGAAAIATAVEAGPVYVAGFVSGEGRCRLFDPVAEGNSVATGDAVSKWLPTVKSFDPVTVTDYIKDPTGATTDTGQVVLELAPAAGNIVEAPSVMTFRLDPRTVLLTATGTGTF